MVEHLKVLMVEHLKVMAASRACLRILNSRACLRILMVEPPKGSLSVEPPKGSLSVEPPKGSLSVESLSLMLIGWGALVESLTYLALRSASPPDLSLSEMTYIMMK